MGKTSSLTKKLALTISSIVLCVVLVGVVVYAALTQSVDLTNTIKVSVGGQAKSTINVYEQIIDGTTAVTELPEIADWGTAVYTKETNLNQGSHELTPIVFSYTEKKINSLR